MSLGSAFGWDQFASAMSQERQMDRDADAADTAWRRGQENMRLSNEFTERMSNTAHQRAVVDLKAAGLNPLLSATKGMQASSGTGAMANAPTQSAAPDFTRTFGPTIREQANNIRQDSVVKTQQGYNLSADTVRKENESNLLREQLSTQQELTRLQRATANSAEEVAKGRKLEGQIDEGKWGEFFRYLDRIRGTTGAIRDIK